MGDKAPAFQFYAMDYLTDEAVLVMTYEQRGIYDALLCHQWLEGSISDNPKILSKMLGCPRRRFEKLWPQIAACFVPAGPGRLLNERLERQRRERDAFIKGQAEAGHRGAKKRWGAHREPTRSPIGLDESSTSTSTSTSKEQNHSGAPRAAGELVQHYKARFRNRYGDDPVIDWKRDTAIMAALLRQKTQEEIAAALDSYFVTVDPFIASSGHTMTFFRSQFNRILTQGARPAPIQGNSRTVGNIAALQRFVERKTGAV